MRASSGDFVPGRVELGGTPSVKGQGLRPTWVDNLAHSRTCCSCIEAMAWGLVISEPLHGWFMRSEEHTSELQSLMRISSAVFRLNKTTHRNLYQASP